MARRILFAALLGIFAVAGGLCATASAEDAPGREKSSDATAVSQLTSGELELLQQRIKNWSELPVEKQERIARRVLSLRNMTDEERTRLRDRIAHKVRHPDTIGRTPRDRLPDMRHMWAVAKGLGALATEGLISKDVQRAARAKGIHSGHLEAALLRRFFGRLQQARLADIESLDPSTLPPRLRLAFQRLQRAVQSPDLRIRNKARLDMAQIAVVHEVKQLLEGTPRPKPEFDKQTAPPTREQREAWHKLMMAHYRKIGQQVQAKWPAAFAATREELAAVATDGDALAKWVESHGSADARVPNKIQLLRALMSINSYVARSDGNQALRDQFDALLRTVLTEQQVPEAMIKRLIEAEPRRRGQLLMRMLKERGDQGWQRRDGARKRREGGMRRPDKDDKDEKDK
jgi:hypothetical protein